MCTWHARPTGSMFNTPTPECRKQRHDKQPSSPHSLVTKESQVGILHSVCFTHSEKSLAVCGSHFCSHKVTSAHTHCWQQNTHCWQQHTHEMQSRSRFTWAKVASVCDHKQLCETTSAHTETTSAHPKTPKIAKATFKTMCPRHGNMNAAHKFSLIK